MHLTNDLRAIRGDRTVNEIAEAAGVNPATIRQIEQGRLVPKDSHIEPLERAYGEPISAWYNALSLIALQHGDSA
jgi:transcriptional regulator with XRE-family HTH domain